MKVYERKTYGMTNVHWMGFEVGLCPRLYTKKNRILKSYLYPEVRPDTIIVNSKQARTIA